MSTGLDIISGALTMIGQLGQGQTPSAEDSALGLRQLNLMLGEASTKRLMISYVAIRQYTLSSGISDYTIGAAGSIVGVRPTLVESAQIQVGTTSVWLPMSILDKPKWDALINKGATADVPERLYPEYTSRSIVTIRVDPKPLANPGIKLGVWEPLTQFASVFTSFDLPDVYENWLESKLGVILAPYYDQPVPQSVTNRADRAELSVMQYNAQSMGGALSPDQTLQSPNVGQPMPGAGGPGQ